MNRDGKARDLVSCAPYLGTAQVGVDAINLNTAQVHMNKDEHGKA